MAVYGSPAQLDLPGVLTRGVRSWFGSLSSPESGSLCLSAGPAGHHPKQCPSPWWCHPALITTEHLLIWWHLLNAFHGMWKQLSVNTWDEASPAILDQLWCSLCVLMAGTAWVGMALCSHLSQLSVTLGLHKGQGSAHPNTTWQQNNKHEVVSAGIFQLKEGKERAEHWLVVSTCHDSSVCPGQSPAGDKQLPCKTPAGNLVHNTGLAFFTSILLWQFKPSGFCCSFFSSGWSNQIKHM